jgi:hypothetical protein
MTEAEAVVNIAGDPGALCHVRARDIAHLRTVIDAIRRSSGVIGAKTLMDLGAMRMSASASCCPPDPRSRCHDAGRPLRDPRRTDSPGGHLSRVM